MNARCLAHTVPVLLLLMATSDVEGQQRQIPSLLAAGNEPAPLVDAIPTAEPATLEGLLAAIRRQPGGAELLEEARLRGAPISEGLARQPATRIRLGRRARTVGTETVYSYTLTPEKPRAHKYAYITFYGVSIPYIIHKVRHLRVGTVNLEWPTGTTHHIDISMVRLNIMTKTAGWYVVNFRGWQKESPCECRLVHGRSWSQARGWGINVSGGTELATWSVPAGGYRDYPAVVELSPGWHYFYFHPTAGGTQIVEVSYFRL